MLPGDGGRLEGIREGITKEHKETFRVMGMLYYFYCDDGFMVVYFMCQNLSKCTV